MPKDLCRKCGKEDPRKNPHWVGCEEKGQHIWFCSWECYWDFGGRHGKAPCCGSCHLCGGCENFGSHGPVQIKDKGDGQTKV